MPAMPACCGEYDMHGFLNNILHITDGLWHRIPPVFFLPPKTTRGALDGQTGKGPPG